MNLGTTVWDSSIVFAKFVEQVSWLSRRHNHSQRLHQHQSSAAPKESCVAPKEALRNPGATRHHADPTPYCTLPRQRTS